MALLDLPGLPSASRKCLQQILQAAATPTFRWLDSPGHYLVPLGHPHYPQLLAAIPDPPALLYVDGQPHILNDTSIAIVGSRQPTPGGRETAQSMAAQLAATGMAVVSGLAEGIDSAAHHGALRGQGVTIAVFGNGIDRVYPCGNTTLAGAIRARGALVSAFPLGTPPRKANFPQRNRVLAGMSRGTLVVEAARQSGSLITARLAGDFGREVFAVPGSIYNPLTKGCHSLIQQGAKLTESAADILAEFNLFATHLPKFPPAEGSRAAAGDPAGMDKDQKILLDALGFDPTDFDSLIIRTGFRADVVSSMMLILELEGHVQSAAGGCYSRVLRSRG